MQGLHLIEAVVPDLQSFVFLDLDVSMNVLPMREATNQVEFGEILIGRHVRFDIVAAKAVADERFADGVLWLSLMRQKA